MAFSTCIHTKSGPRSTAITATRTRNLTRYGHFVTRRRLRPAPTPSGTTTYHSVGTGRVTFKPDVYNRLCGIAHVNATIRSCRNTRASFLILTPHGRTKGLLRRPHSRTSVRCRSILALVPLIANPNMLTGLLSMFHSTNLGVADFVSQPVGKHANACDFVTALSTTP